MTVEELLAHMGGYILSNKARVKVDGKEVVIGRLMGPTWVFTDAGQKLATQPPVVESEAPKKQVGRRPRKISEPSVELGLNTPQAEDSE